MGKVEALISYKVKVREFVDGGKYIDFKKKLSRSDCNLKAHQHTYYNCDMFPSILKRAALEAQKNREWSRIEELGDVITIDTTGFLATLTMRVRL